MNVWRLVADKAVDLLSIFYRKIDEINIETRFELMFGNDAGCENLMSVGQVEREIDF